MAVSWSLLLVLFKVWKVQSSANCMHTKTCGIYSVYLIHPLEQYLGIPLICNHWNHNTTKEGAIFALEFCLLGREFVNGFRYHMSGSESGSSQYHCRDTVTWHFSVLGFGCPAKCIWSVWLGVACPKGSCLIKKVLFCSSAGFQLFFFLSVSWTLRGDIIALVLEGKGSCSRVY